MLYQERLLLVTCNNLSFFYKKDQKKAEIHLSFVPLCHELLI